MEKNDSIISDENWVDSKVIQGKRIFGIGNLRELGNKESNIITNKDSGSTPIGYY